MLAQNNVWFNSRKLFWYKYDKLYDVLPFQKINELKHYIKC